MDSTQSAEDVRPQPEYVLHERMLWFKCRACGVCFLTMVEYLSHFDGTSEIPDGEHGD